MVNQISNGLLSIRVNHRGAELASLYNHATGLEYLWDADPRVWAKQSPVLFPIVGTLKDGVFKYGNSTYHLPRHGFARDMFFELESKDSSRLVFLLTSSAETLNKFPFSFEFRVTYELDEFALRVSYHVLNSSEEKMYFSVGAHPAFKVPLISGTVYSDYYLKFEQKEHSDHWPITKEGYIEKISKPFFVDDIIMPLRHELFYNDALVFKDLKSTKVGIRSNKHVHGVDFSFPEFPFFAIWSARDAEFVCLEPWCGIADSIGHDQQLQSKEGIIELPAGNEWRRTWSVSTF